MVFSNWTDCFVVKLSVFILIYISMANAQSPSEIDAHYSDENRHEHEHLYEPTSQESLVVKGEISKLFAVDQEILQITQQQQKIRSRLIEFQVKKIDLKKKSMD